MPAAWGWYLPMADASDLVGVIGEIVASLDRHEVGYFLTGLLASSVHGEFRATNDIDIAAELGPEQLASVMAECASAFVADRP